MDEAAEEAIKQIDDMQYTDALLEEGYGNIGRYGISFFRKNCRVHYRDGYLPCSPGLAHVIAPKMLSGYSEKQN